MQVSVHNWLLTTTIQAFKAVKSGNDWQKIEPGVRIDAQQSNTLEIPLSDHDGIFVEYWGTLITPATPIGYSLVHPDLNDLDVFWIGVGPMPHQTYASWRAACCA